MEEKKIIRLIVCVIVCVIAAYYAGAMFNFFPFIAGDLTISAIGLCTLIICVVIAVCTCIILSHKKE